MQSLTGLLQIAERREKGPSPTFDRAHLVLAFLTIGDSRRIGRQALANKADLGEGAVRTVLKKLRDDGYVDANASGCYLTKTGNRVYHSVRNRLSPIILVQGSELTVGSIQAALIVRGGAKSVRTGIEQRDSAIKVGASGATTYLLKSGRFTIPGGSSDCERDFPSKTWATLRKELRPDNGDAVILSGAESEVSARIGTLSAALTLL